MARTENTVIELKPTSVDIVDFCQDLIQTLQFGSGEKYQFQFEHQQECIGLVDKHLLWHVLTNLFSNAIKYSPEGGQILLELVSTNTEISFKIKDSGVGIPAEDLPYLFEPFTRASNSDNIQGTGLGLTIVKRCVDLHDGHIEVHSKLGVGSTSSITIPKIL